MVELIYRIIKAYDVQVSMSTIKETMLSHKNYPSLSTISDIFDVWNIKHLILNVTLEQIKKMDTLVVVQMNDNSCACIYDIDDKYVSIYDKNNNKKKIPISRFKEIWLGISIVIHDVTSAGEKKYRANRRKDILYSFAKWLTLINSSILLVVIVVNSYHNTEISFSLYASFIINNLFGCYMCLTMILVDSNNHNSIIDKYCNKNKYFDCKQVSAYKYSKLLRIIPWSNIGFAFFFINLVMIILAQRDIELFNTLFVSIIASLVATIVSVYTQVFIIRKICFFCCLIILTIWLNFIILSCVETNLLSAFFTLNSIIYIMALQIMIILTFYLSTKVANNNFYNLTRKFNSIKYDLNTIKGHLRNTEYDISDIGLTLGNRDSKHEIALYLSTSCTHCKSAIYELTNVLETYSQFRYKIIFLVGNTDLDNLDLDNLDNQMVLYFINLYNKVGEIEFLNSMSKWYEYEEFDMLSFSDDWTANESDKMRIEHGKLYEFHQELNINYTPAILVNGQLLSTRYNYQDIVSIVQSYTSSL